MGPYTAVRSVYTIHSCPDGLWGGGAGSGARVKQTLTHTHTHTHTHCGTSTKWARKRAPARISAAGNGPRKTRMIGNLAAGRRWDRICVVLQIADVKRAHRRETAWAGHTHTHKHACVSHFASNDVFIRAELNLHNTTAAAHTRAFQLHTHTRSRFYLSGCIARRAHAHSH